MLNINATVDRCDPIPKVDRATANTTLALKDTIVLYTCDHAYRFPSNYTYAGGAECDGRVWNNIPPSCERKYKRVLLPSCSVIMILGCSEK